LTLIIAHQRLRDAPVPVNDDLSASIASCDVPRIM
jgi:hypothetical protein